VRQEGNYNKQLEENTIIVDLSTGATEKGKLNLPKDTIKASGTILANILLDFYRNGGDMEKLSPSDVFGRKK